MKYRLKMTNHTTRVFQDNDAQDMIGLIQLHSRNGFWIEEDFAIPLIQVLAVERVHEV
jgi:hypothetical protein